MESLPCLENLYLRTGSIMVRYKRARVCAAVCVCVCVSETGDWANAHGSHNILYSSLCHFFFLLRMQRRKRASGKFEDGVHNGLMDGSNLMVMRLQKPWNNINYENIGAPLHNVAYNARITQNK